MYTWLAGAAAIIIIVGLHLGSDKIKANQLDKARQTIAKNAVDIKEYEDAKKTNLGAITALTMANEAWADKSGDYEQRNIELKARLEKQRNASQIQRNKDQAEFKRILADEQKSKELSAQRITDSLADWVCGLPAYRCTD